MKQKKLSAAGRTSTVRRRTPKVISKASVHTRARHAIRSNRSWTKRLFMHPTSTFGLLIIGVLLAGMTYSAAATDYSVNAVVEAAPLQSGAFITSPNDNEVFTSKPIIIAGTCPNDAYIKLIRNDAFSGTAICTNGMFQIETDLFVGLNALQAQAYNITDQPGPATASVTVTYTPPAGTPESVLTAPPAAPTTAMVSPLKYIPPLSTTAISLEDRAILPFLLSTEYEFAVAATFDVFELRLQYRTGALPIATHVEWGDGQTSDKTVSSHDAFKMVHTYTDSGVYIISVQGTDANKRTTSMQLVAFIRKPGDKPISGAIIPPVGPVGPQDNGFGWLQLAWWTYVIVAIMIASFWLGERREFLKLVGAKHPSHRPRHP
ncbi:MAG TPA: hypothetical protein VF575_03750 [Candidatus Saccharimonadales bacterium]|jgi:hypothetical protein